MLACSRKGLGFNSRSRARTCDASSIPGPRWGVCWRQPVDVSVSHRCPSLSPRFLSLLSALSQKGWKKCPRVRMNRKGSLGVTSFTCQQPSDTSSSRRWGRARVLLFCLPQCVKEQRAVAPQCLWPFRSTRGQNISPAMPA